MALTAPLFMGAYLPEDAPTAFLVDVQPEQWPGVRDVLEEGGAEAIAQDGIAMDTLSMGMSDDFPAAILEGATIVRIGTALFGPRDDRSAANGSDHE